MFIKLEEDLYINTDNILSIEIFNISDVENEEGDVSVGYKVVFVSNAVEEYVVMKHEHSDHDSPDCLIEKEIGISPKAYFFPKTFSSKEDALTWIEMNIPNLQAFDKNKLN